MQIDLWLSLRSEACAHGRTTASRHFVNCVSCADSDCQVVWEKKPTPEEEQKAKSLQLPPTFFCGLSTTDSDTDNDKAEDFETEVRKAQQELVRDECFQQSTYVGSQIQ